MKTDPPLYHLGKPTPMKLRIRNKGRNGAWESVWQSAMSYVKVRNYDQVKSPIQSQIGNQIGIEVWDHIWHHIEWQVNNQMRNQIRQQIYDHIWSQIISNQIWDQKE